MKNQIVGNCPVCDDILYVTELECESCKTKLKGEFYLSKFSYLTKEQLYFVEVFIKNKGNIKAIEKEMSISYPTVKKYLDDVISSLGYDIGNDNRLEILAKLESGEITAHEATELLKK